MNDRLYRSRDDRVIGGVCAGLAERLDLDPALVRVGWVILTILTGGLLFLLYIVMLIVVPEEPDAATATPYVPRPADPGAVPGWTPPAPGTGWTPPTGPRPGDPAGGWTAPPATGLVDPAASASPGVPSGGAPDAMASTPVPSVPSAAPAPGWVPPSSGGTYMDTRAARRAARRERRRQRDPAVGLVFGGLLVLLGLYFLAVQYIPSLDLGRFWPVIVIGVGVILIARAFYRPRTDA